MVVKNRPARLHLTSFHGVLAPQRLAPSPRHPKAPGGGPSWAPGKSATLHQRTFGTDVLRCPCGGRRTIRALHSTRSAAEERLTSLGIPVPSRILPKATAPPQLTFAV